jgi:hypothetical protein
MGEGTAAVPGTPVYYLSDGTLGPARANAAGTAYAVGLALHAAADGERCSYRYSGPLTLTDAQVAAILDTGTEFTPGAPYYVSQATAGKLTKTLPVSGIVCAVAVATSTNGLNINPNYRTVGA